MVFDVEIVEFDNDRNSILCLTHFSINPHFRICILFNYWERKSRLHIHENRGLDLAQYNPPQKG